MAVSKTETRDVGFSLVHKKGEELTILAEESSYLGTDASVFQAEVTAIHDGAIESALQVSAGSANGKYRLQKRLQSSPLGNIQPAYEF